MAENPTPTRPAAADDRPDPRTAEESAARSISSMRQRIDEIDTTIIRLWLERRALAERIGAIRVAAGAPRLILSREHEILERFRGAIGADGTQLALLVLKAWRDPS